MRGKAKGEKRKTKIRRRAASGSIFAFRFSLFALLFLAGCSSYAPPRLTLTRALVTQESKDGLVVSFSLDALNTNSVELPLTEVRYTLYLNGSPVFFGVRSPEATLRRLGTQSISFPAVIALAPGEQAPTGAVPYSLEGRLGYLAPGSLAQVLFDLRFRRPTVAFHESGTLDFGPPRHASANAR